MPRPLKTRIIFSNPRTDYLQPRGILAHHREEIILNLDEYEAIRLADLEQHYQEAAARKMGISRQTFGKIVESGRRKIADAIVNAKALKIQGTMAAVKLGSDRRQRIAPKARG